MALADVHQKGTNLRPASVCGHLGKGQAALSASVHVGTVHKVKDTVRSREAITLEGILHSSKGSRSSVPSLPLSTGWTPSSTLQPVMKCPAACGLKKVFCFSHVPSFIQPHGFSKLGHVSIPASGSSPMSKQVTRGQAYSDPKQLCMFVSTCRENTKLQYI